MSLEDVSRDSKTPKVIEVVPWDNAEQFKKVYEYLYNNELKKKRWAVDQISVWESRCHPSLPMAIEASLVISRAIIQDVLMTNDSSLCQQSDIQMMYAMALVRFVNLTIEPHQKELHLSGAQIAKGLGIPSWIVDLRNEATHSFLPALSTLRMAADCAMKYLNESYWKKEVSMLKSTEIEEFNIAGIKDLVYLYILLQYRILNSPKTYYGTAEHENDIEQLTKTLVNLKIYMEKHKQKFVDVLMIDGYFIPFDGDLKRLMTKDEKSEYEDFEKSISTKGQETIIPPVPAELELLWKKLLLVMQSMGIIPQFLETLLKCQVERTEMGKKLVVAWVVRILKILSLGDCFEQTILKSIFMKRYTLINWKTLFHAAVSCPTIYTPCVFPLIFVHLNLNKRFTTYVLDLMAISLGLIDWKAHELPRDYSIQTLDNLKQLIRLQNNKIEKRKRKAEKKEEECFFSYAEDEDYKSWPIGVVLNQVDDDEEENEEIIEDCMPITTVFQEKIDYRGKYIFSNKNDKNEESSNVSGDPYLSEEEIDLGDDRESFLYRRR